MPQELDFVITFDNSPDLLPLSLGAVKRLLLAVYAQAIKDAGSKKGPAYTDTARYWLQNEGSEIAELLGFRIKREDIKAWIDAGCPCKGMFDHSEGSNRVEPSPNYENRMFMDRSLLLDHAVFDA